MSGLPDRRAAIAETRWMGWALFLGISWTWCIGMFLPVLLVRDYGLWGWLVFALPNVIGAAAMGWTITAEKSRQISQNHWELLDCFAMVTAGFQLFFIGWVGNILFGRAGWSLVAVLLIVSGVFQSWRSVGPQRLATAAAMLSALCAIAAVLLARTSLVIPSAAASRLSPEITLLAASCLGFFLCPYLDPTFHRARQALEARASKLAFGVGFGVIFFGMIVFSLFYAVAVERFIWAPLGTARMLAIILLVHWMLEACVTIVFQVQGDGTDASQTRIALRSAGASVLATIGLIAAFVIYPRLADGGELIYWLFMSMYGLFFPAYVWLCVIPGSGRTRPTRRMLIVTAIVCAAAMPFFWLAFIDRHMPVVVGGLIIVLGARVFVGRPGNSNFDQQNSAPMS